MTSTKTIKVFVSVYGIFILFMLPAIISFSLAFAFEMIFPNLFLTEQLPPNKLLQELGFRPIEINFLQVLFNPINKEH